MACDPKTLAADAAPFAVYSEGEHMAVQTYLLAVLAGGSTDPATLVAAAKGFAALDAATLQQVQASLLCSIATVLGA